MLFYFSSSICKRLLEKSPLILDLLTKLLELGLISLGSGALLMAWSRLQMPRIGFEQPHLRD